MTTLVLSVCLSISQAWSADFFANPKIAQLQLTAPFKKMSQDAFGLTQNDKVPSSPGQITLLDETNKLVTLNVSARVRGQSSREELDFPKLKINIKNDPQAPKPEVGFDELRIGTHGFKTDSSDYSMLGRLSSSVAVYREASVYDVLKVLNVLTFQSRRAKIKYIDSTKQSAKPVIKPALLLESDKSIQKRLGATVVDDRTEAKNIVQTLVSKEDLARAIMAEALVGNTDFRIPMTESEKNNKYVVPHNVTVLKLNETTGFILIGDFDLANSVTGFIDTKSVPEGTPEHLKYTTIWMQQTLRDLKDNVGADTFAKVAESFLQNKELLLKTIQNSNEDTAGKEIFRSTVMQFYSVLEVM